jgi:hypothetical protein
MGMGDVLPFARGTYQSGTGLLGEEYWDSVNRQKVKVVKNTDGAALTAGRVAVWEDYSAFAVDYADTSTDSPNVAGVVDPKLASTVPVNSDFYVVIEGLVTLQVGSGAHSTAAGGLVMVDDAKSGTIAGIRTSVTTVVTTGLLQAGRLARYGFAVAQAAAGDKAAGAEKVECKLCLRK